MQTARRRRRMIAIAASAVAHTAVLMVVAVQAPRLVIPYESAGPPEPIIPILIVPSAPPPPPGANRPPEVIRLHRRPPRGLKTALPVEPLPVPEAPPAEPEPPPAKAASAFHPGPLPEGPKADLRAALRGGTVGCANPNAVGLTKAERQVCDQQLGATVRITPFKGLGLDADKQAAFDREAASKEAYQRYKRGNVPLGGIPGAGGSDQPWKVKP